MEDKISIAIVALLLAILLLVLAFSMNENDDVGNRTDLTLFSGSPASLQDVVREIKTESFYRGYDNETLAWMESLGNKKVFEGEGIIVIMDSHDAREIPPIVMADADLYYLIDCNVLENRSLGSIDHPTDVLLVKNVVCTGNKTVEIEGGS